MLWSTIALEQHGATAVITLNRPARANTLTAEMLGELHRAQIELEHDDNVRVLVVTGAGRHFCGGRDLQDVTRTTPGTGIGFDLTSKPVIACINGAAVGGGLEVALACDFRFVSSTARLGLPEIQFGELPAGGATARLVRVVGTSNAKRLILTGDDVSAEQAEAMGLVDRVLAPEVLFEDALAFAARLALRAPYAVRAGKLLIDRAAQTDLATALAFEQQVTRTMASEAQRTAARVQAAQSDPTYARIFGTAAASRS